MKSRKKLIQYVKRSEEKKNLTAQLVSRIEQLESRVEELEFFRNHVKDVIKIQEVHDL